MIVSLLGTGSKGNALVVECGGERILIDAGFAARTLVKRMRAAGIEPNTISSLILTHEHGDHVSGARTAARRYGWTVYATPGTIAGTPGLADVSPIPVAPQETVVFDSLRVTPFRTPHDSAESIGMVVESAQTGARCGIVYDLGHVGRALERVLADVDTLIVESNHDVEMLRNGPYPRSLQRRISGPNGHLSNAEAALLARTILHKELRHIVLVHLSEENNTPEIARRTMARALSGTGYGGTLTVSRQHALTRVPVERSRRSDQMTFDF